MAFFGAICATDAPRNACFVPLCLISLAFLLTRWLSVRWLSLPFPPASVRFCLNCSALPRKKPNRREKRIKD